MLHGGRRSAVAQGRSRDRARNPARDAAGRHCTGRATPSSAASRGRRTPSAATSTTSCRSPTAGSSLALGDVAGKGSPAALLMALLLAMLRTLVDEGLDAARLLERLNVQVARHSPALALHHAVLRRSTIRATGTLSTSTPASCRRPPPRRRPLRARGRAGRRRRARHVREVDLRHEPAPASSRGDVLVLYSDGITEAENAGAARSTNPDSKPSSRNEATQRPASHRPCRARRGRSPRRRRPAGGRSDRPRAQAQRSQIRLRMRRLAPGLPRPCSDMCARLRPARRAGAACRCRRAGAPAVAGRRGRAVLADLESRARRRTTPDAVRAIAAAIAARRRPPARSRRRSPRGPITSAIVRERARRPVDGGFEVLAEVLVSRGRRGRIATWRSRATATADAADRYEITAFTELAALDGLLRLALDPRRIRRPQPRGPGAGPDAEDGVGIGVRRRGRRRRDRARAARQGRRRFSPPDAGRAGPATDLLPAAECSNVDRRRVHPPQPGRVRPSACRNRAWCCRRRSTGDLDRARRRLRRSSRRAASTSTSAT